MDAALLARNMHGAALVACYEETIEELPDGANPDLYWLISIESVCSKQKIDRLPIHGEATIRLCR